MKQNEEKREEREDEGELTIRTPRPPRQRALQRRGPTLRTHASLNFAWSYNPNRNFDITYYRFKEKTGGLFSKMMKRKNNSSSVSWKGTRLMLIPEGITPDNKSSMRIGFLRGGKISEKFGYEIGYYHDFNSMPLSKVFDSKWNITGKNWQTSSRLDSSYNGRYDEYDPMYPGEGSGAPSEYSRATGLSLQVFYYLGRYKKKS